MNEMIVFGGYMTNESFLMHMPPETTTEGVRSSLEGHIEQALRESEDDEVRYHLREALQIVYGTENKPTDD